MCEFIFLGNFAMPKSPEDVVKGECDVFLKALENPSFWKKIPTLSYLAPEKVTNMQLVRVRGFLQDMLNDDIYVKRVKVRRADGTEYYKNCKYREWCTLAAGETAVEEPNSLGEMAHRQSFYLNTVPGMNSWARQLEQEHNDLLNPADKVAAGDENMDPTEAKRSRLSVLPITDDDIDFNNSPIRERPSKGCLVRVYEKDESLTLNCLVDVVGFVWVDDLPQGGGRMPFDDAMELCKTTYDSLRDAQGRILPRLHALAVHKLAFYNPLVDMRLASCRFNGSEQLPMRDVFLELVSLFELCLFNDTLASEYLVLHLISHVHKRTEGETIGKFSLNLWNVPAQVIATFPKNLYEILEMLLPASHFLPLSLATLNERKFTPSKNSDSECLESGLLQLADHTHLVIDATVLDAGPLVRSGFENVNSLQGLVAHQTIRVHFPFYHIDYNTDIPVLVISERSSPLKMECDVTIPLKAEEFRVATAEPLLEAVRSRLNGDSLPRIRSFLTRAKTRAVHFMDGVEAKISDDYVEMRQANKCGPRDLHTLLVLMRLMTIIHDKDQSDLETWERAKEMHFRQVERVASFQKELACLS